MHSPFVLGIQRKIEIYFVFLSGGVSVVPDFYAITSRDTLLVHFNLYSNLLQLNYYGYTFGKILSVRK